MTLSPDFFLQAYTYDMINIPFHNSSLAQQNDLGIFAALPLKSRSFQVQQPSEMPFRENEICDNICQKKRGPFCIIFLCIESGTEGTQVH